MAVRCLNDVVVRSSKNYHQEHEIELRLRGRLGRCNFKNPMELPIRISNNL